MLAIDGFTSDGEWRLPIRCYLLAPARLPIDERLQQRERFTIADDSQDNRFEAVPKASRSIKTTADDLHLNLFFFVRKCSEWNCNGENDRMLCSSQSSIKASSRTRLNWMLCARRSVEPGNHFKTNGVLSNEFKNNFLHHKSRRMKNNRGAEMKSEDKKTKRTEEWLEAIALMVCFNLFGLRLFRRSVLVRSLEVCSLGDHWIYFELEFLIWVETQDDGWWLLNDRCLVNDKMIGNINQSDHWRTGANEKSETKYIGNAIGEEQKSVI